MYKLWQWDAYTAGQARNANSYRTHSICIWEDSQLGLDRASQWRSGEELHNTGHIMPHNTHLLRRYKAKLNTQCAPGNRRQTAYTCNLTTDASRSGDEKLVKTSDVKVNILTTEDVKLLSNGSVKRKKHNPTNVESASRSHSILVSHFHWMTSWSTNSTIIKAWI